MLDVGVVVWISGAIHADEIVVLREVDHLHVSTSVLFVDFLLGIFMLKMQLI